MANNILNDENLAEVNGGTDGQLTIHTVRAGETLKVIAEMYGTKTGILLELNPAIDASLNITEGEKVLVPRR